MGAVTVFSAAIALVVIRFPGHCCHLATLCLFLASANLQLATATKRLIACQPESSPRHCKPPIMHETATASDPVAITLMAQSILSSLFCFRLIEEVQALLQLQHCWPSLLSFDYVFDGFPNHPQLRIYFYSLLIDLKRPFGVSLSQVE